MFEGFQSLECHGRGTQQVGALTTLVAQEQESRFTLTRPRISYLIHDTIKGIIYKVTNTVETILPVVPSWTSVPYFAFFTDTLQIDRPREKRNHHSLQETRRKIKLSV